MVLMANGNPNWDLIFTLSVSRKIRIQEEVSSMKG